MNCQEYAQDAAEYVLGTLAPEQARALRVHLLEGCPTCAAAVAEAEATATQLGLEVARVEPSPAVKQRVLDRIRTEGTPAATAGRITGAPRRGRNWLMAGLAAAAAAIIAVAITTQVYQSRLSDAQQHLTQVRTQMAAANAQLQAQLTGAQNNLRILHARNLKLVAMHGTGPSPNARAHLFWDEDSHAWYLHVTGLAPTAPSRTYELWLIAGTGQKQTPIPAGTFTVSTAGTGSLHIQMPAHAGKPMLAAVTEEPAGGVPAPTGKIQLMGHLD